MTEKKKKVVKKVVSSKSEITPEPVKVDGRSTSMRAFHAKIDEAGSKVEKFTLGIVNNDLLRAKMVLMEAVRLVERKMRERRN